jgi:MgtE intracellular N domain
LVLSTNDVVAQIMSAGANQAANMLLGMPAVQIRAVLNDLGPAEVARVVVGAHPDRKADLLGIIGSDRMPAVLSRLTVHQLADVVSVLPIEVAVRLVHDMSPRAAADLLLEIPTQRRAALQEAMTPSRPDEFAATVYQRHAEDSILRIATRVSWLDQSTGSLLTEVLGRPVQVTIRYRADPVFSEIDLHSAAQAADWRRIVGLVVLTNAEPVPGIALMIRDLRTMGHAIEVVPWLDDRDDGLFKRALVRLAG